MNGVFFLLSFYCFSRFINIGLILRCPYLVCIVPCGLVTTLNLKNFPLKQYLNVKGKIEELLREYEEKC